MQMSSRMAAKLVGVVVLGTTALLMDAAAIPHTIVVMSQVKGASVSGRVVNADRGERVARVNVELVSSGVTLPSSSTIAGDNGEFVFENVEPGRYWLRANKMGWHPAYWGQRAPEDEAHSIVLQAGDRRAGLDIALRRFSVIVGRVSDEFNEPIEGAIVSAAGADLQIGRTNDIGEFRIPRVQPGIYVVSATAQIAEPSADGSGRGHGVSPAVSVEVDWDGEVSIGELVVRAGEPREVRGRAVIPTGLNGANVEVILLEEQSGIRASTSTVRAATTTTATGEFVFRRIGDGRYRLRATHRDLTGFGEIVVAGNDVDGVTVLLQQAAPIIGLLTMDSNAQCRGAVVRALSLDDVGAGDQAALEAPTTDGRFTFPPRLGRQQFEVRCAAGQAAVVDHIVVGNRRIGGSILETAQLRESTQITLHGRVLQNRVSGTVIDAADRPADGLVVLVQGDADRWRRPFQYLRVARVIEGAFDIAGIPPGRYHLIHEPPRRRTSDMESPQYLQRAIPRRAKTIDLKEDTDLTVQLRIP
jgi:hypothetical protein